MFYPVFFFGNQLGIGSVDLIGTIVVDRNHKVDALSCYFLFLRLLAQVMCRTTRCFCRKIRTINDIVKIYFKISSNKNGYTFFIINEEFSEEENLQYNHFEKFYEK
jgi:hypothetical protein